MTTLSAQRSGVPPIPAPARARLALTSLTAQVQRDVLVAAKAWRFTLMRIVVQPFLTVFVFAFVLPHAGEAIAGDPASSRFATTLLPGVVGLTAVTNAVQAVAMPMITDFNVTREIEDRLASPVPSWSVALQKILMGAIEGIISGLLVLPIAIFLPARQPMLHPDWLLWPWVLILVVLTGGALGLVLGATVQPQQVQLMFIVVITPMTFLGATFYSWVSIGSLPWLRYLLLANPVMYANEALRGSMTPGAVHMWIGFSVGGLFIWLALATGTGVRAFVRKCSI